MAVGGGSVPVVLSGVTTAARNAPGASGSPLLDVLDTGAGKLIRWNGPDPEGTGAASETEGSTRYAGAFAVKLSGGTSAQVFNGSNQIGRAHV